MNLNTITLVAFSICVFSISGNTQVSFPVLKTQNPAIAQSEDLREDEKAIGALAELINRYKQQRRERIEEGILVPIYQEDLNRLYNFAVENRETDSALTAKLLLAELVLSDARKTDWPYVLPILKDVAENYPQTWQGIKAHFNSIFFGIGDPFGDKKTRVNLELLRTELIRQLPIAKSLDNSTRADIQAYCDILSPFKMEVGCLEGLGDISEKLGDYDAARDYYEKIIRLYPGTTMETRAKNDLRLLEIELAKSKGEKIDISRPTKEQTIEVQIPVPLRNKPSKDLAVIPEDVVPTEKNTLDDTKEDSFGSTAITYSAIIITAMCLVVLGVACFMLIKRHRH